MIPYGRQEITSEDIDAVVDVLRSECLTQGPVVPAFEQAVAAFCGARYAVATNSATSALHLACLALGVGPGDSVWTTPITFVASANCARYCGASVDFVDVDPKTYNVSPSALAAKLARAEKNGTLPRVIIVVHLAGQSCDMEAIHSLTQKYGIKLIEDASHAIGGSYKGNRVGGCQYSDITVFSFHPVKIITTGEGGLATTNDLDLVNRMMRLRSHGITRAPGEMTQIPDGPWFYQQMELGYNYRMTDIQAALGVSQLRRIGSFLERRRAIVERYNAAFTEDWLQTPFQSSDSDSAWHLYIIRVRGQQINGRKEVFERLRRSGILANLHYIPVYKHPYYKAMGYDPAEFPEAEAYYREAITLPIFPGLTSEDQDEVIKRVKSPFGYQNIF